MRAKLSEPQMWLMDYCRERWFDKFVAAEYAFHPTRKWRFDVAVWGCKKVAPSVSDAMDRYAFEIEGGLFMQGAGRHNRGAGMRADMEKYNHAAALNWQVFRFTPEQILKGEAKAFVEENL